MIKILNKKESLKVLQNNYIGNLAYVINNHPYIVPMTYYFDQDNNVMICYSAEGHKIKSMRKNNNVAFEVTEIESVHKWMSVMAHGTFEELVGSNVKLQLHTFSLGVKAIIKHKEHREVDFISEFSSKIYKNDLPIAFLIKITEITGKGRNHLTE
jgi:hypothetical protein